MKSHRQRSNGHPKTIYITASQMSRGRIAVQEEEDSSASSELFFFPVYSCFPLREIILPHFTCLITNTSEQHLETRGVRMMQQACGLSQKKPVCIAGVMLTPCHPTVIPSSKCLRLGGSVQRLPFCQSDILPTHQLAMQTIPDRIWMSSRSMRV